MNQLLYEADREKTYIVYQNINVDLINKAEMDKLGNAVIPGLLQAHLEQAGLSQGLKYDISGYVSLKQMIFHMRSRLEALNIFKEIAVVFESIERNGFRKDNLILEMEYIFIDSQHRKIKMIYVPKRRTGKERISLREGLESVFECLSHSSKEYKECYREVTEYFNNTSIFSAGDIVGFFESRLRGDALENTGNLNAKETNGVSDQTKAIQERMDAQKTRCRKEKMSLFYLLTHFNKANCLYYKQQKEKKNSVSKPEKEWGNDQVDGQTEYHPKVNLDDETELIQETPVESTQLLETTEIDTLSVQLIRCLNREVYDINVSEGVIGKSAKGASFAIEDNKSISRRHAKISIVDKACFIEDLKSTNCTYVNDEKLKPFKKKKIRNNDVIRLANEEFIVRIN